MTEQLLDQGDGVKTLYEQCLEMKVEGASNGDLRSFLADKKLDSDEVAYLVKQVDSDFLHGVGVQKKNQTISDTTKKLIGWLLVTLGLTVLVLFYLNGGAGILPILICFSLSTGGLAMVRSSSEKNLRARRQKKKISLGYFKRD